VRSWVAEYTEGVVRKCIDLNQHEWNHFETWQNANATQGFKSIQLTSVRSDFLQLVADRIAARPTPGASVHHPRWDRHGISITPRNFQTQLGIITLQEANLFLEVGIVESMLALLAPQLLLQLIDRVACRADTGLATEEESKARLRSLRIIVIVFSN
jgi:hypothetical protein